MKIKEFKNGNFNVQLEPNYDTTADSQHLIVALCNSTECDFELLSEEYCLGNSEIGQDLYNNKLDKLYVVTGSMLQDFRQGKSVKLYTCCKPPCHLNDINI